ncbi:MAG: hypothetical protein KC613_06630 [Myxococcales bacterium]|nr:hypothetical protein [Myxococcales bacterium]
MIGETLNPGELGLSPGMSVGQATEALGELRKALNIGNSFPADGQMNAGQLMAAVPQDLSHLITKVSFDETQLTLWRMLQAAQRGRARSTVHQFLRIGRYGNEGENIFFGEGGLPTESSTERQLASLPMSYAGTVRRLTLQAAIVPNIAGDTVKEENEYGALEVCQGLEHALFFGDREVNPFAFDGIKKQVMAEGEATVLDPRGGVLTAEMVQQAMFRNAAEPNFGKANNVICSPQLYGSMVRVYNDRLRKNFGDKITPVYTIEDMTFPSGKITFNQDVFLQSEGHKVKGAGGTDASKRPLPPVIEVQPATAADPNTKFLGADAGNYIYWAQATSPTGRSAAVKLNTVAVADGERVAFTLRDTGVGTQKATGFKIYRTLKNGAEGTARHMVDVKRTGDLTQVVDLNQDIPGTQSMFFLSVNPRDLQWVDFLPFFNFPLGRMDTSFRWALLQFGALKIGAPRHHFIIKNIQPDFDTPLLNI